MDFSNLAAQLNAGAILPEGIVIVTLLTVLLGDLIGGRTSSRWTPYGAIAGLLAAILALVTQWDATDPIAFLGSFNGDALSIIFRSIVVLSALITIPMSVRYVEQSGTSLAEFLVILMTATLGGMFLAGADELVMIFVALETLSISSYLLTGYMKRDPRSNEAALKYLLIGAASSAIFLYGVSLLYGLSGGETRLTAIAASLATDGSSAPIGLVVALVFVIAGAGFALAIRLLVTVFPLVSEQWHFVFTAHHHSQHGAGQRGDPGPNQHEANAGLLLHCPSGLCDDWPDYRH
jgi:NAD(P)H-quinone oxidoreductase subunit 2